MALWSALLSRPARVPLHSRPSRTLFFLLAGAFLLTLVPQVLQFPLWLSVSIVVALILRSIIEIYRLPLPSSTFCGVLAIMLLGLILWWFSTVLGRDAGTALTAGLLTIKFYEIRRLRDVALIIFSCFFMVMSALLYSQVLELFIYCLIMMWVLTALLMRVQTGDLQEDRLIVMLRRSGLIFVQALPFALFLFFLLPRYTGRLSISMDGGAIGLTDTVAPGSIARLSADDSEAMHVQFTNGNVPNPETMYMRGIVLWTYSNGVWTAGEMASYQSRRKMVITAAPGEIKQKITVKPHNQRWLFALDVPISLPVNESESFTWAIFLDGDVVQLSSGKLNHQARYTVISSPHPADEDLRPAERSAGTLLPRSDKDHIDPGVVRLADDLHRGLSDSQELTYISRVLRYFHQGGFTYTSTPGPQAADWLPDFLLKSKAGFCEHFASAFAVLMRQQHIPTRVIAGYLGADYNPYADNYVVSQSNAHAWDEVWIPSDNLPPTTSTRGYWRRVDPTSLIGEGDLGQGARQEADATDPLSQQIARHKTTFSEAYLPGWARNALREMQLRREQVEADWDDLVFSYDPEVQNRLAEALGLGGKTAYGLFLLCGVAFGISYILVQRKMAQKKRTSPVESLYANFCRDMARRGVPRAAWEGPFAYTDRVAEAFPDDRLAIQRVGAIVARARYGPAPIDSSTPHQLQSLLTILTASQAAATSRERH